MQCLLPTVRDGDASGLAVFFCRDPAKGRSRMQKTKPATRCSLRCRAGLLHEYRGRLIFRQIHSDSRCEKPTLRNVVRSGGTPHRLTSALHRSPRRASSAGGHRTALAPSGHRRSSNRHRGSRAWQAGCPAGGQRRAAAHQRPTDGCGLPSVREHLHRTRRHKVSQCRAGASRGNQKSPPPRAASPPPNPTRPAPCGSFSRSA